MVVSFVAAGFFSQQQQTHAPRTIVVEPQRLSGSSQTVTKVVSNPRAPVFETAAVPLPETSNLESVADSIVSRTGLSQEEVIRVLQRLPDSFNISSLPKDILTALVEQRIDASVTPHPASPAPQSKQPYRELLSRLREQYDFENEVVREQRREQSLKSYLDETGGDISNLYGHEE